jgi:hypothetical protein
MTPETYGNIHVTVNMAVLMLLEGLCLWGLWKATGSLWVWVPVSIVVFFVVAYLGHRLIPMLTGSIVDALIRDRIER